MWNECNLVCLNMSDQYYVWPDILTGRGMSSASAYCQWSTMAVTVSLTIPGCPGASQPKATHGRVVTVTLTVHVCP